MPETARAIIKEQMATDGEALPWKNKELYMQLMVKASTESYREAISKNSLLPVFLIGNFGCNLLCPNGRFGPVK